jgi:hypothetical protein
VQASRTGFFVSSEYSESESFPATFSFGKFPMNQMSADVSHSYGIHSSVSSAFHPRSKGDLKGGSSICLITIKSINYRNTKMSICSIKIKSSFSSLKSYGRKYCSLICYERKIFFRLKNKLKSTDYSLCPKIPVIAGVDASIREGN